MPAGSLDQSPRRQRELPTFYYHKHFLELLDFVAAHYRHILSPEQVAYITDFRALDRPAQCFYVRLVNRKGRVFAVDKLRYPEIGDMAGPVAALRAAGWVTSPGPEFFREVLGFLTKAEILTGLAPLIAGLGRGMSKRDLVTLASERADPEQFIRQLDPERLLLQRRTDWVRFLLFLYFGEVREGLSRFTMRDMGLVRTHSFTEDYEPRFADREEAVETYYFAARLRQFEKVMTMFGGSSSTRPPAGRSPSSTAPPRPGIVSPSPWGASWNGPAAAGMLCGSMLWGTPRSAASALFACFSPPAIMTGPGHTWKSVCRILAVTMSGTLPGTCTGASSTGSAPRL